MPEQIEGRRVTNLPYRIDKVGLRYGRLTVREYAGRGEYDSLWRCQCDCGEIKVTGGSNLQSGGVQSCGCLHSEVATIQGLNSRKYKFNEAVFDIIDSSDKAYWLGFILADGNIRSDKYVLQICLKLSDRGQLIKFLEFLNSSTQITDNHRRGSGYPGSGPTCRVSICSKKLCTALMNIGIVPNKTLHTRSIHEKIPNELWRDYWRGVIDGDGCFYRRNNGHIGLSLVGDRHIVESFAEFCNIYVDFIPRIRRMKKIFTLGYHSENANILSNILYGGSTIYLDRKYALAMECINMFPH